MSDQQKSTQDNPRRYKMSTENLTQKEKELIAVGVSIAAGCQPCTAHHFKAVRAAGAKEEEIRQAVDDALCVRNSATKIMTALAEEQLGNEPVVEEEPCGCDAKPLIGELVSIGAALAVNCKSSLETHLKAARAVGASERQIQTTLGLARSIRKVAGQKAEVVVDTGNAKAEDECDDDCGCNDDKPGAVQNESCGCSDEAGGEPVSAQKEMVGCC